MDFKDKRITVVGLARSGVGAANLLAKKGALVTITDKKTSGELEKVTQKLVPSVNLALGDHPAELFEDADLIVISPGVPMNIPPLQKAKAKGISIVGELELAYQIANSDDILNINKPSFLSVTGTNGKSTTTTLLHEMVKNSGLKAVLGGNIGNALTDEISDFEIQKLKIDHIVVEVSSFQLESILDFRPAVASILNITHDHLDRYNSMNDYIDAKCRIFMNQTKSDSLVLNADDPATDEIMQRVRQQESSVGRTPEIFYFSRKRKVDGVYLQDNVIRFNLPESKIQNLKIKIQNFSQDFGLRTSDIRIKGVHNIENAMAASLMALLSGCSMDAVADTLKDFPGLEHRLEFVREIDGVKYINDSKGTNTGAVMKSLESFDVPVILIAGGRDKDSDFSVLRPFVSRRVKAMILIGEAKEKIKKAVGDTAEVFVEESLKSAVIKAKQLSQPDDVVLLSPACASFDMFIDFEDRGRQFKKIVMEL